MPVAERSKARVYVRSLVGIAGSNSVAERSKARVCGRSLTRVAGSNPAGAWMFVLYSKDKKAKPGQPGQSSTNYRERTKIKSRRGYGWLSVVSVVCCQVEVFATGRSLVQRSPTDCGVSLCVISEPLE